MNRDVFITCAVTGSGDTAGRHARLPITPQQIAIAAVEAARAGAAIVHIHVRDPETGKGARSPHLFAETVHRIRDSGVDVILNLTAGMGGDVVFGQGESPLPLHKEETDMVGPLERLWHVEELRPEICTLDCGTMNFAEQNYVMTNTPGMLAAMARRVQELGVRPELEIFDSGHLVLAKKLIADGLIDSPYMLQLCMGIAYGAPDDVGTLLALVNQLPQGAVFSTFSIARNQLPYVALAAILGGNVRVGLEDNLYLQKGVLASNAELVQRAVTILQAMNVNILSAAQTRAKLQLKKHA